jgi:hypothetical protein
MGTSAVKVPQAALLHALKEAGWVDVGRIASGDYLTKRHTFAERAMVDRFSKSDLRRMVEDDADLSGLASDIKKVLGSD